MLTYFLTTVSTIFFGTLFFKIDGHNILRQYITSKKGEFKRLYNLVATRHTSRCMIMFISIEMLLQAFYQSLVQYLDESVKKIGKNKYELKYVINGKLYKKIIIPERGPLPIICITDENGRDVTDKIIPYIGPNHDFHNEKFYPNFFGYTKLVFEMSTGDIKTFNNSETIII